MENALWGLTILLPVFLATVLNFVRHEGKFYHYNPQFTDKETEMQSSRVSCLPMSPGTLARPKLRPGSPGHSQMWLRCHHSYQGLWQKWPTHPNVPRNDPVLKLKVPHPGNHFNPGKTEITGHSTNDSWHLWVTSAGTQDVPILGCHIIISDSFLSSGPE